MIAGTNLPEGGYYAFGDFYSCVSSFCGARFGSAHLAVERCHEGTYQRVIRIGYDLSPADFVPGFFLSAYSLMACIIHSLFSL